MPSKRPARAPYPGAYSALTFLCLIVGVTIGLFLFSNAVRDLVPIQQRVLFMGQGSPSWAIGLYAHQAWACSQHECGPELKAGVTSVGHIGIISLAIAIVPPFFVFVLGTSARSSRFRRRPPTRDKSIFRVRLGRATGLLALQGHGASIIEGAEVFLSGDDLCQNTCITGSIGSGKTTGAIIPILRQLLKLILRPGMLIFDVKGDFGKTVMNLVRSIGGIEVTKIGVGGRPINLLAGLSPEVAASFLKSVLILAGSGGQAASVYLNTSVDLARNMLGVLSFTDDYSLRALYDAVYYEKTTTQVDAIAKTIKSPRDRARFDTYAKYLQTVFPAFEPRIKNGARTTLAQVLDAFNLEEIDQAFCRSGPDAITMEEVLDGRIFLMDLPISKYGLSAKTAYTMVKLRFFNVVDQRRSNPQWNQERPLVFVCDEYQEVISVATDAMSDLNFWDKSRSARCAGIISAQGYSSFQAVIKDPTLTRALLQNFRQKITFRSEDSETLKFFGDLLGDVGIERATESRSSNTTGSGTSTTLSVKLERVIDPQFFRTEMERGRALCLLSIGGKAYDDVLTMPYDDGN